MESDGWADNSSKKNDKNNKAEKEKLVAKGGKSAPQTPANEPANAYQKIDVCVNFLFISTI